MDRVRFMKRQIIKQIIFWCIVASLSTSCTSITKNFPKQPRPFQEREFNSEQWKSGDYQTRGEMGRGKLFQQIHAIKKNPKEEVLQLLGKPDEITQAICCYSGRGGTSKDKVELWLYYIEIDEGANDSKGKEREPLTKQALKIYFNGTNLFPHIGDRDGDHSYFPMMGYLNRNGGKDD